MSYVRTIKRTTPKARKIHRCDLCDCDIEIGTIYIRETNIYDDIYDFIYHSECRELASKLNMYNKCDEGLNSDSFTDYLRDEVSNKFYDDEKDDIKEEVQGLSNYELVVLCLE